MNSEQTNILILFVHPVFHKSRINRSLIEAVSNLDNVLVHKLYEEYPDFHIDIKREQSLLLENDIIIWHHPFYWYSAPAILKEWIDLVLQHNFAYGKKGTALTGKYVMSTVTMGGQQKAYQEKGFNHYTIRQFMAPYEQTVRLCNMHYLPPFIVHGTHLIQDKEIDLYAGQYKNLVTGLRDNNYDMKELMKYEYVNDILQNNP